MVKRTLVGKVARKDSRTWQQVAEDSIRFLCDGTVTLWLSNGEDEQEGRCTGLSADDKGLRIMLDSGKVCVWKMGRKGRELVMRTMGQRFGWHWVATGQLTIV